MAYTRPINSDPLRSFKFNVNIPIPALNGSNTSKGMARYGFMGVSGIGMSIEPLTYREGGDNVTTRKMPGQADFGPITLSRGLFPLDNDNWLWTQVLFSALYGGDLGQGGAFPLSGQYVGSGIPDFRTPVYINVLMHPYNTQSAPGGSPNYEASYPQQNSIVAISIVLYSAWIGSIAYSDLDAGGNAVGVEQITLNYEGFNMFWGNPLVPSGSVNKWAA